ncbi:type III effector HrpK domain-containing protein [Xanthomonas sp. WHRI 1810A]|uniref:type III effector HrpK domain-containing protein n=1 Tax=Xanthomonas sp. WHRI 1810A TaxID=3161565 RepID=UPI0032E8F273
MSLVVADLAKTVVDKVTAEAQWDGSVQRAKAKEAGIEWELPQDDQRSTQQIIDDSPLLKNLGNQSDVKEKLKDRVGDFDTDRDAAYRATQVLEHIEQLDEGGNRVAGKDVNNGRVDGFTSHHEARHGTEAGRLQDFGKYGFDNLEGKLKDVSEVADDPVAREKAEALGIQWERPDNDERSAQQIIDDSPLLKNLGNQSGVKDMLKEQVGDFETDPDAAFRATQVLDHIARYDGQGERLAGNDVNNDSIDGFTKSGEAKHNTEAGRLQDFGKDGFDSLHGKLESAAGVGSDPAAREAGEKAGIVWELPKDDERSAQDIIDANPLLKNLGNQSGVKDALKERVGDFEKDPDAAFRAIQVLDRVVGYAANGEIPKEFAVEGDVVLVEGNDPTNTRIDGFTKSGEARNGTEAGRLQDFGKYGFEALPDAPPIEDVASFKDYLKAKPDADDGSKEVAQYAAVLEQKYDEIRGKTEADGALTEQDIKDYIKATPQLSGKEKEGLEFWSQPGAFKILDTASNPLANNPDGKISKTDMQNWLKNTAPADATTLTSLLSSVVSGNVTHDVDTSKLGADVFEHPEKYTTEQKAAVLLDLQNAQKLVVDGATAGMWGDDYGKVAIANGSGALWEPDKVLQDITDHITLLQNDKPTSEFLKTKGDEATKALFDDAPGLKDAVTKTYEAQIKSGKALDKAWDAATKDGKTDQPEALTNFYATAHTMQSMLGIDNAAEIQSAVGKSSHSEAFKTYYKDSLASGERLRELLKTETPEAAAGAFSMEVALYNATLDPEFTGKLDTQLNDNFTSIVQQNAFKGATFEDLKVAYGKDGGAELDEDKVRAQIEQVRKESPELLMNADGTMTTTDQILAGVRGNWDVFRQGIKALDKMELLKDFDTSGEGKGAYSSGTLHMVSGIFLGGVTIARGVQSGGNLTERNKVDIVTGSVQTATVLTEGGTKAYTQYLEKAIATSEQTLDDMRTGKLPSDLLDQVKDNVKDGKNAKIIAGKFEEGAKGLGGLAGMAVGAYGIFDGVKAIRRGDNLTGGFGVTAGSLGVLAGAASTVEGSLGLIGANLPRFIPFMAGAAGVLGVLGAGVAILGAIIPGLVREGQQQAKVDDFAQVLGGSIERYGIDGVKDGTISDIPTKDWPGGEDSTIAS